MPDPSIQKGPSKEIPALGYDPTTNHAYVPLQVINVVQDPTTGQWYGVLNVNASFSASSLALNDPTTPANKATVDAGGNLHVAIGNTPVPVALTTDVIPDTVATGNLTAAQPTPGTPVAGGTVSIALGDGQATWEAQLTGTFNIGTTIQFEGTADTGTTTNWLPTVGYNASLTSPLAILSISGPGPYIIRGTAAGYEQIRMRASALTALDNVAVRIIGSNAPLGVGGILTNDGSFSKESGGNLATLAGATASNTAAKTSIVAAASDTSLLASNLGRKGALFYNDSTAILYLSYGSGAASTSSYTVQVPANGFFELPPPPVYTGAIRGIWSAANGNVRITEIS